MTPCSDPAPLSIVVIGWAFAALISAGCAAGIYALAKICFQKD